MGSICEVSLIWEPFYNSDSKKEDNTSQADKAATAQAIYDDELFNKVLILKNLRDEDDKQVKRRHTPRRFDSRNNEFYQ